MPQHRPVRQSGQDIRTLPTYTIPEAASFLAINQRTLFSWYAGDEPILKASGCYGSVHLLSYRDIEEAYRVHLLCQKYNFSFQFLRRAMRNARKMFRSQHPLQRLNAVKEFLNDLVYDKPKRGRRPRTVTSIGRRPGQQVVQEVVDLFSERIVPDKVMFPWRFAAIDKSRPVSLNPHVLSGRLVIAGTRIPVKTILGYKRAGAKVEEIANDYGLEPQVVKKALAHIDIHQKAA